MRIVTKEIGELRQYLEKEFGSFAECPKGGCVVAPPVGVPFEVVEPLQTEPHAAEINRNVASGLTKDSCVPVGIYAGIEKPGIMTGTSIHYLSIGGSEKHGTRRVCIRMATGNTDWRGVKSVEI